VSHPRDWLGCFWQTASLQVCLTLKPFDPEAEKTVYRRRLPHWRQEGVTYFPTLGKLALRHFRCFERFETEFAPGLNFIVGPNARGKTSLLEAVCVLLRLQSPRVTKLAHAIQHERRGFAVDGYLGERHMQFYFSRERKKLALDEVEQKSAFEYLRMGRLVYFSNSDIDIARGSGEVRRRFLDFVAAQRESGYRKALREYERALRSRNLLLKAAAPSWREIAAFDEPLVAAGESVARLRRLLVDELQHPVNEAHAAISGTRETLRLEYVAGSGENFAAALAGALKDDARLRQTNVGPHRDDLHFYVNDQPSDFASEGQQRTLVLALKLGASRLLERHLGAPPLLLLDDIFGDLDPARRNALLEALPVGAQKLVTSTHLDWMRSSAQSHVVRLDST
jgi:DNA replication and repair protein RecF